MTGTIAARAVESAELLIALWRSLQGLG